jgi:phosphatidylglycerol lysyltransferase
VTRNRLFRGVLRVLILALAGLALRRELVGFESADLLGRLRSYALVEIAAAVAFTAASFLTLGALEIVTLRHVGGTGTSTIRRRVAFTTAYVAHAFGQSVGFGILTGGAVRLRAYARHGLAPVTVARLSTFVTLTMTVALLATTGISALVGDARSAIDRRALPDPAVALLLFPPLAYLAWSMFGRRDAIGRGAWRVPRPSPRLAAGQIALSALDWLFTGMVLFLLLPAASAAPFSTFFAAYMLAQTVGFVSQIPGGVGAFDAMFLALVSLPATTGGLAAALVMYRIIYYLLPLCGAIAVFGFRELNDRTSAATAAPPGS